MMMAPRDELLSLASDLRVDASEKRDHAERRREINQTRRTWPEDGIKRIDERAAVMDRAADILETIARAA